MPELTPSKKLRNLADALVEDVMKMSDEEIMADAIETYGSLEAAEREGQRIQEVIMKAVQKRLDTQRAYLKRREQREYTRKERG